MADKNDGIKTPVDLPKEDRKVLRRKEIGDKLRSLRRSRGYNLVELSKMLSDRGYSLSASQLSRIETGEAPANTDDLSELVDLFNVTWEDLLGPRRVPWFIVRKSAARERLQEVIEGKRTIIRRDDSHQLLIEKGVYKYVPLEQNDEFVASDDEEKKARLDEPMMQKYLFEIGTADAEVIIEGLDNHAGEEVIYVIKGELEFWFHQETDRQVERRILKEGDCLQYSSNLRHGYRATGKQDVAEALFVYCDIRTPPPLMEKKEDGAE